MNSNSAPSTTHNVNNASNSVNAGCSKFPSLNTNNNTSDQSLPTSSPTNQLINDAFPSPPSTSTSSQPNYTSNFVPTNRSQIHHSKSATTNSNLSPNNNNTNNNANVVRPSGGNNFLNFLFRTNKKSDQRLQQNYISNEGSITVEAWRLMSKQANTKVRLKTLETLSVISQKKKLQVATLEGIWSETKDLLDDPTCRLSFLNLIYNITISQITELGLALRLTFFETIRSIGLTEVTSRWLTALSDNGKLIEPFEMSIFELLSDWIEKVVLDVNDNTTSLAPEVCLN